MTYDEKTRIGITGLPGSGKSTLLELLTEELTLYGIPHTCLSLSDEVRELTTIRNLEPTRPNLRDTANFLRQRYGNDIMAELLCKRILTTPEALGHGVLLFDGIRTPEEVDTLRRHFGDSFVLIGVIASEEVITSRLRRRSRADEDPRVLISDSATKSFLDEEAGAFEPTYGLNISGSLNQADAIIRNDGALGNLRRDLVEILNLSALKHSLSI